MAVQFEDRPITHRKTTMESGLTMEASGATSPAVFRAMNAPFTQLLDEHVNKGFGSIQPVHLSNQLRSHTFLSILGIRHGYELTSWFLSDDHKGAAKLEQQIVYRPELDPVGEV